ncbi:pyridoxamine 5'-phosphate oxidase [Marinitenerispora sediminis]|uniref:Pyridoxine/pyridoxamine 5'-phosphate oxidase n=1 Tax=Marinitenerispora sediminis TaxID=1931232 RepID=A0A368T1E7_9ACTN|nr:pyridoxamine 5'-phosphate oxidase [Marinitenerispora sediminis]RCV50672.1 pyridoxamine 5'-phosphate oxidase [Marinitenerispora sediminis]RCV54158.1 pyridoxamine 5'-phosphate oxidase [Marinitenerispora sediminis]RCV54890.1 pyridoxamine 5'-phosphate oxidase [Marinitenerispora sediminis]
MNHCDPAELREPYDGTPLRRADLSAHPMKQFHIWFTQAHTAGLPEPNAMVLATVDPDGAPSARTVLLKGYDRAGLRFFTNYTSRKARALSVNPRASVVFPWHAMRRQVIVTGRVECLSAEENDAYFASRPHGSQIGAWASEHQSAPVADRAELDARYARFRAMWPEEEPVPRPEYWGGYRVLPAEVEFWQGRPDRMHDRFRYRRAGGAAGGEPAARWDVERLSP